MRGESAAAHEGLLSRSCQLSYCWVSSGGGSGRDSECGEATDWLRATLKRRESVVRFPALFLRLTFYLTRPYLAGLNFARNLSAHESSRMVHDLVVGNDTTGFVSYGRAGLRAFATALFLTGLSAGVQVSVPLSCSVPTLEYVLDNVVGLDADGPIKIPAHAELMVLKLAVSLAALPVHVSSM